MIISITGLIGSGKDTVASYLVDYRNFTQLSFASTLKDVLSVIFGWDRTMLEGKTKEAREARNKIDTWWSDKLGIPNFTPRMALTMIGTDVLRDHFNDSIWISALERKLNNLQGCDVVISDARYINELNMLRDHSAKLLNISRGPNPNWFNSADYYNKSKGLEKKLVELYFKHIDKNPNIFNQNVHSSEYDWISYKFDNYIFNNKDLTHLYKVVDTYLNKYRKHKAVIDRACKRLSELPTLEPK